VPQCTDSAKVCDGLDASGARADEGCGDDEEGCGGRDRDENPVRFEDGSVESQIHALVSIPGNGVLGLDYAIQYQSRLARRPADTTADFFQDQHFLGYGWIDGFADRLVVPTAADESTAWMSLDRTVSFDPADEGDSDGGRFHLTDRGAGHSPRWVVTSRERGAPLQTWEITDASGGEAIFRGERYPIDSEGRIANHGWALTLSGPVPGQDVRGLLWNKWNKATLLGAAAPTCLAKILAHEALHPALASLRADELFQAAPLPPLAFLAGLATSTKPDGATSFVTNRFPNSMFPSSRDSMGNRVKYQRNPDEGYAVDAVGNCIGRCK
jgi:hypothetical protein